MFYYMDLLVLGKTTLNIIYEVVFEALQVASQPESVPSSCCLRCCWDAANIQFEHEAHVIARLHHPNIVKALFSAACRPRDVVISLR